MIKLDLSKAYDRLNWEYLKLVLASFGFCNRWIAWVSDMIYTLNYSILLNGMPTTTFNSSRGLREGDPLSPFLFIIAVEGLGRYIKKELQERKIKGLRICGNDLPIREVGKNGSGRQMGRGVGGKGYMRRARVGRKHRMWRKEDGSRATQMLGYFLESENEEMARLSRGRGRGSGRGGRGENAGPRKGRKPIEAVVKEAKRAYRDGMDVDIHNLIQEMEHNIMEDDSKSEMEDSIMEDDLELEMEEWEDLVPNPGHTRGRMTLFKQTVHIY